MAEQKRISIFVETIKNDNKMKITKNKTLKQVIKENKLFNNSQSAVDSLMEKFINIDKLIQEQDPKSWEETLRQRSEFAEAYMKSCFISNQVINPVQYIVEFSKANKGFDLLTLSFSFPNEFRELVARHFMFKK